MNGIYIHIPFCKRKCKYCDFVSYAGRIDYADAYLDVLECEMKKYAGEKADTVFVGGGTPSVLSAKQLTRLTKSVFDTFDIAKSYEFTVEVNPGTLDARKTDAWLLGGVNRVSVGVQSFNDTELRAVGRIHTSDEACRAVTDLSKAGFKNISIDLMTALPDQTMDSLKNTLRTAVSLPITHISAYSLIIEDGTPLAEEYDAGTLNLPSEDEDREMYSYVIDYLAENGFNQYEISNFAKEGYECAHNIKYWTFEPYIGLGVAAHSFDGNNRAYNTSDFSEYTRGAEREVSALTKRDRMSEFIITGLRMNSGISSSRFAELFGETLEDAYGSILTKFESMGLIKHAGDCYSLTRRGIDVSNSVLCEFV